MRRKLARFLRATADKIEPAPTGTWVVINQHFDGQPLTNSALGRVKFNVTHGG